jgi:hypothetical protein
MILRRYCLFVALLGLSLAPATSEAQFLKNLFGGRDNDMRPVKRKPVAPKPKAQAQKDQPLAKKKEESRLKLAETEKKDRYRVDVLGPLYLSELVSNGKAVYKSHLPDKALPGVSFYQGIKLAVDTLGSFGYKMDVYFHDITDPAHSIDALLKGNKLDSSDLIIGNVQATQVAPLAAFAKKKQINFVSALSPSDANVSANLYFNLLQPSLQLHCEAIRDALNKRNKRDNIVVYRRSTNPLDEQCYKYITRDSSFNYSIVSMNVAMPTEKLANFLDSNVTNVIVMPIVDLAYSAQLLQQLSKSFPEYVIEVYGMPSWKGMSLLNKEGALTSLGITVSAPFYFDPSVSAGKGFSEMFTRAYGGRPSEMAFRGYETLYWYAYMLNRYGTIFNDHLKDSGTAPFTRFDIELLKNKDGKELYYGNTHVYFYRYQGGSYSVIQ